MSRKICVFLRDDFYFFFFWRTPETSLKICQEKVDKMQYPKQLRASKSETMGNLCLWSGALPSSLSVLGFKRVCPRKVGPWPWPRILFESLASNVGWLTPPLDYYR